MAAPATVLSHLAAFAAEPAIPNPFASMSARERYMERRLEKEKDAFGRLSLQLWQGSCRNVKGEGHYAGRILQDCLYFVPQARPIVFKNGSPSAVPPSQAQIWMGRVVMLNASPELLLRWATIACNKAGKAPTSCIPSIAKTVSKNSAAQFPVAGIVIEADKDAGGKTDGHIAAFFKDGVTVWTSRSKKFAAEPKTGENLPGRQLTFAEIEDALADLRGDSPEGIVARKYSRITGISAQCYQQAKSPDPPVWLGSAATPEWLSVVRLAYLDALDRPDNGYVMFDLLAAGTCQ
jgi:hypothetical protein